MAKMIAFGDSFTWGSDMDDTMRIHDWQAHTREWKRQPENNFKNLYSRFTWQAKVAEKLSLDYKCLAEQGCSNQSIVRQFFKHIPVINKDDLVSVNFTWRDRYDFYNDLERTWETVRPSGTEDSKYYEMYYKHIQSSQWDQIESLKAINLVISYLKLHRINFVATCIDETIYNDKFITDPIIETLTNAHKNDIKWFDNLGFYEWSKINNYPISPMWHPLEEAHEEATDYVMQNWEF